MDIALSTSRSGQMLGGGAAPIELSLIAARASAAMRRASDGEGLDERDLYVLGEVGHLLTDAAGALEFFGSGGQTGAPPSGALASRIDAAIDAAIDAQPEPSDPHALVAWLREAAAKVNVASSAPTDQLTATLADFFHELSTIALRQTGHTGEVTATL